MHILRYRTVESTNSTAYDIADNGASEWTVVIADVQTQGRGRHGKVWVSPVGGLYFSVILRPKLAAARASILQFYASNAVRRTVSRMMNVALGSKWPNDLVYHEKKVGGILVETKSSVSDLVFAIVGVGVNLYIPSSKLPTDAISLIQTTDDRPNNSDMLEAILDEMLTLLPQLNDPRSLLEGWWVDCVHRDLRVVVESSDFKIVGKSIGISDQGSLLIRADNEQVHEVVEGTLRLEAKG